MNAHTDNVAEVGLHVFEKAGLGVAPFRFVGCFEDRGPKDVVINGMRCQIGSEGQPMGCCAYCGQGIAVCCSVKSADGKTFTVGQDCVARTGDAGLIKGFKKSPEARAMKRAKAKLLADKKEAEIARLMVDKKDVLASIEIPTWDGKGKETQFDYLSRVLPMCGASGKARYLRQIKKLVAA